MNLIMILILILIIMLKLMLRVVSDSVPPPVDRVDQREVADKKTSKKNIF